MRRKATSMMIVMLVLSLLLSACQAAPAQPTAPAATQPAPAATAQPGQEPQPAAGALQGKKVLFEVYGYEDAYNSEAIAGVKKAAQEFGFQVDVTETGDDPGRAKEDLSFAASSGDYEIIIAGTYAMVDPVKEVAGNFPKQKFIFFDENVSGVPNIVSTTYDQLQGSFMAGALAGLVTSSSDMADANPEKVVGFIGGVEDPTVNEFRDGFAQGAKYVDPGIEVLSGYVGSWNDPAKGKEMALAQIQKKADVIFAVGGGSNGGVYEEATTNKIYAIASDTNENPNYPGRVISSMLKLTGDSLYELLGKYNAGELTFGENIPFGVKEGGVGLAKDEFYDKTVSASVKDKLLQIEKDLVDGKITVTR